MDQEQLRRMKDDKGFVAALDQSGGSTPKALKAYGVEENAYSNEDEMFRLVHAMRTRIVTSPSFTSERILGAILFEQTMDREVEGKFTPDYLWEEKGVVPFLKVDKGLADEENGVQLMKPMPDLDDLLDRANERHVFGTKMRSVVHSLDEEGIAAVVEQQFEVAKQIISKGLVPIIEPEVSIKAENRAAIEEVLEREIRSRLNELSDEDLVMLKLTIPEQDNLYKDLISHKNIVRVLALSGGFTRNDANARLARNNGMIASFSRALAEGLSASLTDEEFNSTLDSSIESIYQASVT